MGASMSTIGGWALIICIAGFYAYRYKREQSLRDTVRAGTQRLKSEPRHIQPARKDHKDNNNNNKSRRQRSDNSNTKNAQESSKAKAKQQSNMSKVVPVKSTPAANDSSDDSIDNREFARQFSRVQQGTKLNGPAKSEDRRQKSVKQSQAHKVSTQGATSAKQEEPKAVASPPSSTAGADADDDDTSANSPDVKAADANDVSDMLEKNPDQGPAVLRLTDTEKAVEEAAKKNKKKKPANAEAPVETKKQRQNREKAQAAKADREEAEKLRKAQMEQQRRLARLSEGRPAKDGSAFVAAQAVKDPAWGGNRDQQANESSGTYLTTQLLDTVELPSQKPSKPSDNSAIQSKNWMSSLPPEEEQMQMLRDEEAWSTVTKKSKAKKKDDPSSDTNNDSSASPPTKKSMPTVSEPTGTQTMATNGCVNGRPKTIKQQTSFAALSSSHHTSMADEEYENEWDV